MPQAQILTGQALGRFCRRLFLPHLLLTLDNLCHPVGDHRVRIRPIPAPLCLLIGNVNEQSLPASLTENLV